MDSYGKILNRVAWPLWERVVRRRPVPGLLAHLRRTQWCSRDELQAIQDGELRRLLDHAYRSVPWYQRQLRQRGLSPSDIRGREDLHQLPVLTREAAQESAIERTSRRAPKPRISKSTSGTMGRPLTFAYDVRSEWWRNAIRLRSYEWCGYPVGARSLHYWARPPVPPTGLKRGKIAADRAIKRELYVDCTPRSEEALAEVARTIARHRPEVLVTFSQAGASLARFVNRSGLRDWPDMSVICGAERLHDADRQDMREAFGADVFETYGARETMLIACECPAHDGLHEASENVILEVVVRHGDEVRPARPGETGEVLVTDLHNFAMPLIRYANGDRAVAGEEGVCACGRAMPRVGPIEGRVTETLRDGLGNEVSGLVFNLVFVDIARVSRQFQVVQHPDRSITLKLVPMGDFSRRHEEQLRRQCAEYIPGVPLSIERVDDIPLTGAGKRKVVVVEDGGDVVPSPAREAS